MLNRIMETTKSSGTVNYRVFAAPAIVAESKYWKRVVIFRVVMLMVSLSTLTIIGVSHERTQANINRIKDRDRESRT